MTDDIPQRYDPHEIETALRESRDRLADLAEQMEEVTGEGVVELLRSDALLIWMALKLTILRL